MKTKLCVLVVTAASLALSASMPGQPREKPEALPILQGRPDAAPVELLGGYFESHAHGIAFDTPANAVQVKKSGSEIARFVNDRDWEFVVARMSTPDPVPLTTAGTLQRSGLLELTAAQIKSTNPGAQIVRQDTVNVGEADVGMIAARVTVGTQRRLLQQAIIQANDQLYYTLTLVSPGVKPSLDGTTDEQEDPEERLATETFRQLLDSVKFLDRTAIREDQNQRLFRTRALLVNINERKLREVMMPEQWLRLLRDGKDIGYTYVVEETGFEGAHQGVRVGMRSQSKPDPDTRVDVETWLFMSFDRNHENWSNQAWILSDASEEVEHLTELGASDRQVARVLDERLGVGHGNDPRQPPVRMTETYRLRVKYVGGKSQADPVTIDLPPFYVPQAMGHLLPRLVPLDQPKTYLFATYSSDEQALMMRYVDVEREGYFELAGQRVRAVSIRDRLGIEGDPTVHYMSLNGRYLGSVNAASGITILPADEAMLQKIWGAEADFSRPREVEPEP